VAFALDRSSVVSGYHLRGIEVSEILSLGVSFHGANRNYHALSLQVLFYSYPELFTRFPEVPFGMTEGPYSDRPQDST
jgi:hypothetical protein